MPNRTLLQKEHLVALVTATTGSSNGGLDVDIASARTVEVWITVTALTGTLSIDPRTSLDGTNFASIQVTPLSITATGTYVLAYNRAVNTLGMKMRLYYTVAGGGSTATFFVDLGRYE